MCHLVGTFWTFWTFWTCTDRCRCNRCRSRKTRCAGNPPLPCAACVDINQACVYSEAEKRVSITERYAHLPRNAGSDTDSSSYYRHLQTQARSPHQDGRSRDSKDLEHNRPTPTPTPSSVPSTATRDSNREREIPLERDDWWFKGTDNLLLNRSGEHRVYPPPICPTAC